MTLTAACLLQWQYFGWNLLTCFDIGSSMPKPWQYLGQNLLTCMTLTAACLPPGQYLGKNLLVFIMILNLITADMATLGLFIMVVLTCSIWIGFFCFCDNGFDIYSVTPATRVGLEYEVSCFL